MRILPWLFPGLRIKRWLVLAIIGLLTISAGIAVLLEGQILGYLENLIVYLTRTIFGSDFRIIGAILIIFLGLILVIFSIRAAVKSFLNAFFPEIQSKHVNSIYQRQHLRRGPRIVVIGGGTGLSVLLRGLKNYTSNITAVVSVTDDGGSSGRLRGQFGILPPGDLRNCLVALADTEPTMEKIFNYRFKIGKDLAGHNLGNLLITAMADLTGNFEMAIKEMSKVLAIRGRVIPSTLDNLVLAAELQDGSMIMGETVISKTAKPIKKVFTIPNTSSPVPEAIEAIMDAEVIIIGPGSLYTSIIPNLLVPGIAEAVEKAPGLKIFVCNVMTQPGETRGYTASDHLKALLRHGKPGLIEYVIVNNEEIPESFKEKYAQEGAAAVEVDREKLSRYNVKVIEKSLILKNDYIRHDPGKLAQLIIRMVLEKRESNPLNNLLDQYLLAAKTNKKH